MQRLCPRCHNAVTFEDANTLVFCGHCGAPQIRLSEELLDQAESHREAAASQSGTPSAAAVEHGAVDWQGAIRCAALAGGIAFALTLLSIAAPPVGILAFFWAISAPITTLGIYSTRFRQTRILPSFGARLGLITGMAVILGMASVNTTQILIQRTHGNGAHVDAQITALFAQFKANSLQQSGTAAQPILSLIDIPEFRAGFLLSSLGLFILMYLVFSATFGAFAGFIRARKPSL